MKVISVVGARPQFIKLGPLSRELRKTHEEVIIHTGQHYDKEMSGLFFEQLEIPKPDINLEIGSGQHGEQTGKMLKGIEEVILRVKPDLVLSFGDTNSTLAACLAAAKLEVPSLHIEAGLRSFNRAMPEEINRIVADHTADLLFAPTKTAVSHLEHEGLGDRTVLTGDIMADSVRFVQEKIKGSPYEGERYALMTLHRPYNVDDPDKLSRLLQKFRHYPDKVVFPVHPRTRNIIRQNQIHIPAQVEIIDAQGYIAFQRLLKHADKVITDSGGLQKEAYLAGKPCITLRPETEWVETVEAGWNVLMDINDEELVEKISSFNPKHERPELYGTDVSVIMVSEMERWLTRHNEKSIV